MAAEDHPTRVAAAPPPQARMGLLDHLTATSLDEDYAHVSTRRASTGTPAGGPRGRVAALVVLLLFGALVAAVWGVDAEGRSLEEIAPPLTEFDEDGNQKTLLPV